MQPVFIKTSKGFVNLNHVSQVTISYKSACISKVDTSEPVWIDDEEEVSQLRVVLDKIALFDITTQE